jgi:NADH-quinone oxidoreductase subunit L
MVTAGVYMIGRNAVLFGHAPETLAIVAAVGVATALMAGTIGLVQNDIKRVLAYSTVSQLGLMFVAMGVGAFAAGIFHLYTHAFFKALLFLGSGAVIHALAGEQDIRRMGGLRKQLPVTYWTFLIGALAISGVPLLSGFFSKDEILWKAFSGGHTLVWGVAVVASLLTAIYMFRLVFLTFHGERRSAGSGAHAAGASPAVAGHGQASASGASHAVAGHGQASASGASHAVAGHGQASGGGHLHDAPPAMAIVLILLAVGSVFAGYIGVPAVIGGRNRIEHFLAPSFAAPGVEVSGEGGASHAEAQGEASSAAEPAAEGHAVAGVPANDAGASPAEARGEMSPASEPRGEGGDHRAELLLMAFSSGIAIAGIGIAVFFFLRRRDAADRVAASFAGLHRVLLNKYYVDEIYDAAIVQPIARTSDRALWRVVDAGLIDGAVNGAGSFVNGASAILRRLQTGSMRAYALSVFVGVVLILGYYVWR